MTAPKRRSPLSLIFTCLCVTKPLLKKISIKRLQNVDAFHYSNYHWSFFYHHFNVLYYFFLLSIKMNAFAFLRIRDTESLL